MNTTPAQLPHALVMIRPRSFGSNPQTIGSNTYQQTDEGLAEEEMNEQARKEYDDMVAALKKADITVLSFDDRTDPVCPDAIFPNNWFSTHPDGTLALYPMMAKNRRTERRQDIVDYLEAHYELKQVVNFAPFEKGSRFLEGTGSMVFDHTHGIAYACRSPRTQQEVFYKACETLGYKGILFEARDEGGRLIYHTNVMMWIGSNIAALCLEAIPEKQRNEVLTSLEASGREILLLTQKQVNSFAGNMLEVSDPEGSPHVVMSAAAWASLDSKQQELIKSQAHPLPLSLDHIEKYSGGSARCMMAGIHLPLKPGATP
ncbi:citrulline utilization hydrolase CtlX [Roseivirga sp. BDSF3-8]|uniref:citrulline utilization hydrolase CtlX n=1 Tax=Roseivirga sp. BDSF3-8 TaxID=3241598 RepID=UPI00353267FC